MSLLCPEADEQLSEETRESFRNVKKPDIRGIDGRLGTMFFEKLFGFDDFAWI